MKFCKDCLNYKTDVFGRKRCYSEENGRNKVTGDIETESPALLRELNDKCGPDANWFEDDSPLITSWIEWFYYHKQKAKK